MSTRTVHDNKKLTHYAHSTSSYIKVSLHTFNCTNIPGPLGGLYIQVSLYTFNCTNIPGPLGGLYTEEHSYNKLLYNKVLDITKQ